MCQYYNINAPHMDANEIQREKVRWEIHKNAAHCHEQILEAIYYTAIDVQPLASHLINEEDKQDMRSIVGETRMNM